jgi:hypothetical protein
MVIDIYITWKKVRGKGELLVADTTCALGMT